MKDEGECKVEKRTSEKEQKMDLRISAFNFHVVPFHAHFRFVVEWKFTEHRITYLPSRALKIISTSAGERRRSDRRR